MKGVNFGLDEIKQNLISAGIPEDMVESMGANGNGDYIQAETSGNER